MSSYRCYVIVIGIIVHFIIVVVFSRSAYFREDFLLLLSDYCCSCYFNVRPSFRSEIGTPCVETTSIRLCVCVGPSISDLKLFFKSFMKLCIGVLCEIYSTCVSVVKIGTFAVILRLQS